MTPLDHFASWSFSLRASLFNPSWRARAAVVFVTLVCGLGVGPRDFSQPIRAAVLCQREPSPGPRLSEPRNIRVQPADDDSTLFARIDFDIASKNLNEAEAALKEYLRRKPDSAGALYRLGRVYFDRHEWARSASYLEQSVKLAPRNDHAHLILGLDFFQMNSWGDAERELLTAVQQNPESDENQYMAGRFFFSKFKRTEALAFFYQAVRLNPENFKALHSLGLCFANLGNYAMAENYYKRAIEIAEKMNAKIDQAYLDLADLLTSIESAKVPEGEVYARRAVEFNPQSSQAHYLLGRALYRQGKLSEAMPELTKAGELDPNDGLPHFLLGKIYQKRGRESDADAEWEKFHRLMKLKNESRKSISPEILGTTR